MFFKTIVIISILSFSLFAFDSENYKKMSESGISKENIEKIKKEFGYLQTIKNADSEKELQKLKERFSKNLKDISEKELLYYVDNFYKGNKFLTKEELRGLVKRVYHIKKYVQRNSHMFLLYFYTRAVPKLSVTNILLDLSRLQDAGLSIESKQYFTGIPENIKDYLESMKEYVYALPFDMQTRIVKNFHLKFDPRFFKVYEVKKAPAMAIAFCKSAMPDPKTCKVKYMIRGDTSLYEFFDNIAAVDPSYKKYRDILKSFEQKRKENEKDNNSTTTDTDSEPSSR